VNDDSSSDAYGDTCSSWYDANESAGSYGCTGGYDTDDFSAAEQCCACQERSDTQSASSHTASERFAMKNAERQSIEAPVKMVKDRMVPVKLEQVAISAPAEMTGIAIRTRDALSAKRAEARKLVQSQEAPVTLNRTARPASTMPKASDVKIIKTSEGMTFEADGFVGFEITLEHGDNFDINVTDAGVIASSRTEGNTTKVVVVNNVNNEIFRSSGDYSVVDVVVGTAGGQEIFANVVEVAGFGLSSAYPNPFNPTTSMNLSVAEAGNVTVQVYNLVGQVVSTLADEHMGVGSHSITWNASDLASGVYLVKAVSQDNVSVQKVMLVK